MKKLISLLTAALLLLAPLSAAAADTGPGLFDRGLPSGVAAADDGSFYITDLYNKVIWKRTADGGEAVYAGRVGPAGLSGEPTGGYADGAFAEAAFASPWDIVPFLEGYLVSDAENCALRYLGPDGRVHTAAGTGAPGSANGLGMKASFDYPTGLAADPEGNIYIADTNNNAIRKMTPEGQVTLYAGGGAGYAGGSRAAARFRQPTGLCFQDGALYVADSGNHVIRKIEGDTVETVAGATFSVGTDAFYTGDYLDGDARSARFSNPQGVAALPDGSLYISDTGNGAVRRLANGQVTTLISLGEGEGGRYPVSPRGLAVHDGTLYVADAFAGLIFAPGLDDAAQTGFSDVATDAWYAQAVKYVVARGLFTGTSATSFSPSTPMTRGMLVTVLGRMARIDPAEYAVPSFDDTPAGAYYTPYISWAAQNNIVAGYNAGTFGPDDYVTREQFATILYRYADSPERNAGQLGFEDAEAVSDWAWDAVVWATGEGVITGKPENLLDPQGSATRAEVAVMLYRFLEL